jgi:hypothetical protein
LGAGATQSSEGEQVEPLELEDDDEDDEEDDDEDEDDEPDVEDDEPDVEDDDEVLLDELSPPDPPRPACGSGPGHPATTAEKPAKSATANPPSKGRPPCGREPFDFWYIWILHPAPAARKSSERYPPERYPRRPPSREGNAPPRCPGARLGVEFWLWVVVEIRFTARGRSSARRAAA